MIIFNSYIGTIQSFNFHLYQRIISVNDILYIPRINSKHCVCKKMNLNEAVSQLSQSGGVGGGICSSCGGGGSVLLLIVPVALYSPAIAMRTKEHLRSFFG